MMIYDTLYLFKLRRQARERREYIYRKSIEDKERNIEERKRKLKNALDGIYIHFYCIVYLEFFFYKFYVN